jgi:hypothetical protein
MLATVLAATLRGLEGRPVRVEVDVAPGLPGFTIVGLAGTRPCGSPASGSAVRSETPASSTRRDASP